MNTAELSATRTNVGLTERIASASVGAFLISRVARHRSLPGLLGGALGAYLVTRGVRGQCALYHAAGLDTAAKMKSGSDLKEGAPAVDRTLTVKGTPEELYDLWIKPETLTAIMAHFANVQDVGEGITHWEVKGPLQKELQWNSRNIIEDRGRELAWESLPGTQLPNQGSVKFRSVSADRGTEVTVSMQFEPPLGVLGLEAGKKLKAIPKAITGASLRRFKALAEAGEIPTLVNNPSHRGSTDRI